MKVWLLDKAGKINFSSPLGTVNNVWPGLSRTPDAGFTWTNGLTYFFIGINFVIIIKVHFASFYLISIILNAPFKTFNSWNVLLHHRKLIFHFFMKKSTSRIIYIVKEIIILQETNITATQTIHWMKDSPGGWSTGSPEFPPILMLQSFLKRKFISSRNLDIGPSHPAQYLR